MFLNRKINENAANNTLNKELIKWPIVLMRILGLYHHRQDKIIVKLHLAISYNNSFLSNYQFHQYFFPFIK